MIATNRQTRRRIGVLLASLLLATLSLMTLIQDDSANMLLGELQESAAEMERQKAKLRDDKNKIESHSTTDVHLVVVACEGKSKSAVDEAHNMIKSAILLSIDPKIKVIYTLNRANKKLTIARFR